MSGSKLRNEVWHSAKGGIPCLVFGGRDGDPPDFRETLYRVRGNMKNKIMRQFQAPSGCTPCHAWLANQFRLLFCSCVFAQVDALRRIGLTGTALARAEAQAICPEPFKIGTVVMCNIRRIRIRILFPLSNRDLRQTLFARAAISRGSG